MSALLTRIWWDGDPLNEQAEWLTPSTEGITPTETGKEAGA